MTWSWGPLLCHSSTTITSCCSMIMHGPMLQGSVHNSWKLKTSQLLLPGHVTHCACLGCSGSAYTTAFSSSCQYLATSHSHSREVDQHPTGHNQQPDQLCEGNVLHCVRQMVVTPDTDWFLDPPPPPNTVKLHILEWSFIVTKPKTHL